MPVTMHVTTMEKGGSGNASTTASASTKTGFLQSISKDSPYYEDAQKLLEDRRAKEESDKQKKGQRNAKYFSENIQPFVKTYDYVTGYIGNGIVNWSDQHKVNDYLGMYDSLSENYKKLQDAFVGNDYLRESMSEEDYKKTSEAMDAIGKALKDGVSYVRQAGEVYGQFGNADEYTRHVKLSGMSADELQREIDALDKQIGDMGNADSYYDTMYVMGQPMKKATEKSKKFENDLAELERKKKELTSYRDTARLGENVKKYGVDPSKLSYEALTSYVNDKNLSLSDPGKYDFIKSYYDGMDAGEKADLFVKGLDPKTRDLYEKASELITKNSASNAAFSQGSTLSEASADLKRIDELIGTISSRTGADEQSVRKNIGMVQRYMNAERAEETGKAVVKAVEKAPVLSNIASVGLNLGGGLFALADQAGQTIANIISGENEDIDTNTAAQSIVKISDDIRNATRKKIEKSTNVTLPSGANLGAYLYDTAMSLADVVAQTSTGRVIGAGLSGKALNNAISATTSLIVGSSSAASTVQESVESGESSVKALAKGLAVGLIESLIEKAGIDNVLNATLRGDAAAKVILRSALAEGTEEVLTNIATEDFLESYVFGGSTRYQKAFESYISQGLSREEAAKRASADVVAQDAETFLSSALIGTVFGGVTAVSNRANDKANTKLAQDGINNRIGGIGEIEFLKAVNGEMVSAAEEFNRTHNDAQYKAVDDEVLRRIQYIQDVKEDIRNNSSLRNVIGESGIQQEIQKLDANVQTLSEIHSLIESGRYDPSYQAELILAKEEDLTKTTEEQAKSQRNVLKAAQMYLSAFGSEKKAVEAAKKTAAQENARASELSAERSRLTEALTTADEAQKVEINRRIQEIGLEIKRTARNVIRAGKVEEALGDQYRSAINSALGGNEKELSKRLTNALGREVKVAYDDNAKGFSSMKTGKDSSTLTVNPELILRTENALRQEFGEEYTGNLAKEKLVHEIAHAAARSDANFDAKVLDIYRLLRDNGLITDDDIDEAATREAYKDTLKRYMATEPAKAEVRRLVEAGNAEADAIAAVENAYIGEELVAQTLEWMERATNGQLSREIIGEKRNVFVQALNRIAEIFRSVAAKLKGVDNVNAAKTAGFADKIERFAREFAERGVAEMNVGKAAVSQESAGATQSADNAQGNSGEGAVASGESEATTGTQEEDGEQNPAHAEEENAVLPEEPENEQRAERVQKAWERGDVKKMLGMEDFDEGGEDSESYTGDEAQTLNPSHRAVKQEAESDYEEFKKLLEAMESSDSGDSFDTADSDGGVYTFDESGASIGTREEDERQSLVIGEETAVAEEGDTRYSIKSMRHDIAEGKMFDDLVSVGVFSREEADTLRDNLNKLVNYMIPFAGTVDMNEEYGRSNRPFRAYKPNSDPLYVISLDFSTLCRKRLMTQYVIEQLQLRENRPMTAEEQIAIRSMLLDYRKQNKALQVACAMCYVEAARLKAPKQMERFFTNTEDILKTYFAKKDSEFNAKVRKAQEDFKVSRGYEADTPKSGMKGKDVTALNKMSSDMRRAYEPGKEQMAIIETAKKLPRSTFLTAANLTELSVNHPEIYDAYTSHIRASTRSKSLEGDIPYYYGDSEGIVSDTFIENVNAENGFRFDSWSDFQMKHMLDMITAVIELSVRKSKMHGYTKFPEMVRIFGKTGMMFNLSGVAAGNGFDADGNLAFSDVEGMAYEDAVKLRSDFPETAGFQCIGVSHDHIRALLRSGDIDYVIPYHTSGLNATLRRMVDIYGWKDYTGVQNAKKDPNAKKPANAENWQVEPVWSEFFVSDGKDGYDCMKKTAQRYIDMCHERGLIPKFDEFTDEPNYWKLLIDRKMVNQKTGALIEQKPVRPDFDFGLIEDEVKREVSEYDPKLEQDALNYVVDNFDAIGSRIRELKKIAPKKKLQTVGNEVLQAYAEGSKVVEDERQSLEVKPSTITAAMDADYMAAVEANDRRSAQRLVEEKAVEWGAYADEKGKPIRLYRGTSKWGGYTFYEKGIFTTSDPRIAAGYGHQWYAEPRELHQQYTPDDGTTETLIKNAKNVLEQNYHELTEDEQRETLRSIWEESNELDQRIQQAWTNEAIDVLESINSQDKFTVEDESMWVENSLRNALDHILSLPGYVSSVSDDVFVYGGDMPGENAIADIKHEFEIADKYMRPLKDWLGEHRNEIVGTDAENLYKILSSYDVSDYVIDVGYKLVPAFTAGNLVNDETGGIVSPDSIRDQVELRKNIGAYSLYGKMGDKPLIIDGKGRPFTNVPVDVWEDETGLGFSTDYISKRANEEGYTSVWIKNIFDTAMNNYSANVTGDVYIFFDSKNVRSADPITYDDNGNVIPLSNRFSQENDDIRYSMPNDGERFTYSSLIAKPDMKLVNLTLPPSYQNDLRPDRKVVVEAALENARAMNHSGNTDERVYIRNSDTGKDILVTGDGIRHGLNRKYESNAVVSAHIGELLKNAVLINEHKSRTKNGSGSIFLAAGRYGDQIFVCRIITNEDSVMENVEVLYAVNAKKEPVAHYRLGSPEDLPVLHTDSSSVSVANTRTEQGGDPLEANTDTISIADLLDIVKRHFADVLPKDVLREMGMNRPASTVSESVMYSEVSAKDAARMARMEEDRAFLDADFAKAERTSTVDEKKELGADLIRRFDLDKATAPGKLRDMFLLLERYATLASASDDAQEKSTAEAEAQPKSNRTYKIGDEVQKLEEVTSQIRQISHELIAESGGLDAELLLSENDAKGKEIIEEQANNLEMAAMLGYYAPVDENDTSNAYKARLSAIRKNMNMRMSRYIRRLERQADRITDLEDSAGGEKYRETIKKRTKAMRSMANNPNRKRFVEEKNRETVREITDWLDRVADATTAGGVGNLETELSTDALAVMEKKLLSLGDVFDEDSVDLMKMLLQQMAVNRDSYLEKEVNRELAMGRLLKTEKNLAWMMYKALRDQNRMELNGREYVANYIAGDLIDSLNNRRNVEKEFNTLETDAKGKIRSSSDSGKFLERMEKSSRKTRRWISLNTMDGYSFLRRMGDVGGYLYKTLRAAQSEQIMHVQEYVKTLQDKLLKDQQDGAKGVDLSRYIGDKQKTVTVTLSSGEKYTMTAAQAMTIVTLYEREAGKSHIENGGVRLVHPKDKTLSAAVALKAEDVAAIAQNLDEDDRRVMKVMNDFIREQCTEWGNEATLERYGFHRFNAQHYFPITVDRNALPSNVSAEGAKDYLQFNVQNVGFAKAADASAKAPVVIDSFINVINRHVEGMATYAAYLNAEDIVNRLMSAPGVKDAMQRSLGTGSVKYMTDMMTELKQGNRGGSEDSLTQWWNKSAGHYKSAAVSYNLSTALKQPISIVRAAAVLDPKYILAAKRVPFSGTGKAAHEEMMQYSGIGVKKSVGYSDVGISRDINAQIGYEKKDLSKKVRDVSEFGMALAGYMDERTWDSIWIACREEVKDKKPDLTANHEAFMNEVAKRFAEVVAQTQVVDSPLDSSPLSRSKNPLARNVFAFTSEPIKGFNLLMNAMDDLINAEKGSIRQKQAAAQMARTAVITLVGWAAEASISAAFQMIRDEDDDEGEIAKEFGVKFGKQMLSNAYNAVPYVGQAVDIILDAWKGYDFTDMGIAPLVEVIDSAKSVMDTLRNPENKSETIVKARRDFVESVATFFGIPIRNFNRDAFAVARLLFHGTDWYIHEYEMQKWFYNPKSSTAREKHEFNSLLTDAYLSGNKEAFEHIYNDMRSMGLSPQTTMNGIAKDAYAQDITSSGTTLTRYTPGSDAWYIGMKGIFDRDLSAPDGLEKELTRLYKATEEKGVLPKYKIDSYTVDGESKELSVKDHEAVLSEYSKLYYEIATILRNSPAYKNADDTLKAYWMAQAERYSGAVSIYRVDSEYNLRTKWWEKMKDKPYYDVAGYIITNLKPSKEDE